MKYFGCPVCRMTETAEDRVYSVIHIHNGVEVRLKEKLKEEINENLYKDDSTRKTTI